MPYLYLFILELHLLCQAYKIRRIVMKDTHQLIELLKGHKVYLQTHNFPDPDALASAYGLQQFLKHYDIDSTIC